MAWIDYEGEMLAPACCVSPQDILGPTCRSLWHKSRGTPKRTNCAALVESQPHGRVRSWQLQPAVLSAGDHTQWVGSAWQPSGPSTLSYSSIPHGSFVISPAEDRAQLEDFMALPLKLDPVTFTREQFEGSFPAHAASRDDRLAADTGTWDHRRSIKLAELVWIFDGHMPIVQHHFSHLFPPSKPSVRELEKHYCRLRDAFCRPPALPDDSRLVASDRPRVSDENFVKDVDDGLLASIMVLREHLPEISAERRRMLEAHGRLVLQQLAPKKTLFPSLPDILQRSIARRTKQRQQQQQRAQRQRLGDSSPNVPLSVVNDKVGVVRMVSPATASAEKPGAAALASEQHWRGLRPNVQRIVERRLLELGVPLRPRVPSARVCALYQKLVTKIASEPVSGSQRRRK